MGLNLTGMDAFSRMSAAARRRDSAGTPVMLSAMTVSYPRRQQVRRVMRGARLAAGAMIALIGAALLVSAGYTGLALPLGAVANVLGLLSRRALRLARRSRVGAESEAQIRRALEPLAREGWRVAHGVDWPGRGDLDHVLRSPSGVGFVIETKTLRYSRAHVVRTVDASRWLARKRRRYPCGVLPVVCVTRARRVEQFEEGVLVVSLDRLMTALRLTRPLRQRSWSHSTIA
ncbi:MAG: nuclease-related domain-containing protein [Solirubrobacteraceae bacterium]